MELFAAVEEEFKSTDNAQTDICGGHTFRPKCLIKRLKIFFLAWPSRLVIMVT